MVLICCCSLAGSSACQFCMNWIDEFGEQVIEYEYTTFIENYEVKLNDSK